MLPDASFEMSEIDKKTVYEAFGLNTEAFITKTQVRDYKHNCWRAIASVQRRWPKESVGVKTYLGDVCGYNCMVTFQAADL